MDRIAALTDENFAETAVFSEGTWSPTLPLTNLTGGPYISRPARCTDPTDLAKTKFVATLASPRAVNLVAVLFHNMGLTARYRLTVASIGGTLADPIYQSDWTDVVPRYYDSASLAWEAYNWWDGKPTERDLDLYRRHLWIPVDPILIVSAIRLEFDDRENTGDLDLGALWIASTWSPTFNFDRGREVGADDRSQSEEGPSGRLFGSDRSPRRRLNLTFSNLSTADARTFQDMGMRYRVDRPVIVIPDMGDPGGLVREAMPATFDKPPSATFTYEGLNAVNLICKEILA